MDDKRAPDDEPAAPRFAPGDGAWRVAVVLPDPDWARADVDLPGVRRGEHLLLTLARAAIERVIVVGAPPSVRAAIAASPRRAAMPRCDFVDALPAGVPTPALIVRGGTVMDPWLLAWWAERGREGVLVAEDGRVLVRSCVTGAVRADDLEAGDAAPRVTVPAQHACLPASDAGDDRLYLLCTKPRHERWIVRAVRRRCFPIIAALARRGATPSQLTWASLAVAVAGAVALALGGYPGGIAGAALLAASRWLDTLDGALARLTYTASPAGARLDTAAGRIASVLTALALGWAAFGARAAWRDGALAIGVLLLGGVLATLASHRAERVPPARRAPWLAPVRAAIEHALNREYTVVLLGFAIADRAAGFVWLAASIAYLSAIVDVTLLGLAARRGVQADRALHS